VIVHRLRTLKKKGIIQAKKSKFLFFKSQINGDRVMKRKILFGSSVILLLIILTFTSPASAATFAGHDFTEEYFAVEVDLAVDDPSQPDVISDLLNAAAPTGDSNEAFDVQFYMNYMNNSGIETAFSALEKVEYDLKFEDLLSEDVKTVLTYNSA